LRPNDEGRRRREGGTGRWAGPRRRKTNIALLPGDGIGAEILDGPVAFLRRLERDGAPVRITGPWPYGTTGWAQTGSVLPEATIAACRDADVILSGAVGTHPGITAEQCPNPEAALIELRHVFDLRISVRTVRVPGGDDVTIVRNITGGAYAGADRHVDSDGHRPAEDLLVLEPARVREVFEIAVGYARQHPGQRAISVDKASVFATSRLWRRTAHEVAAASGIPFADVNVDRAAYELVAFEQLPSVIVTEGIFGDILSDVVCARAGSPALCGSATINPDRAFGRGATGLFEPAHGSSPHRTGSRRSNPTGAWLALADLLAWCPDLADLGLHTQVRGALDRVLDHAAPTYDLAAPGAETIGLDEFNDRVLAALAVPLEVRR
jgi:3-isopropylmalate dehydrogenase